MEKFLKYKVQIEESEKNNENYAKFTISPLERGFGNTLGNALRRVCLSSIPGASMFAIKIPGITHEFQAIEGVNEDLTEIILNLKKLVVKIDENIIPFEELESTNIEKWPILTIDKSKKGEILASDIEVPVGFTIINKDLHIATLTKDVNFKVDIYVKLGRGFKSFKENKEGISSLNIIPTDSDFSPVTKFTYNVEEIKTTKNAMSDKLVVELSTNGAVNAGKAIAIASKILVEHFNLISDLDEQIANIQIMREREAETKRVNLSIPIENLNLSVRAYNALMTMNIKTTQEIIDRSRKEIENIRNLGKKSVNEIIKVIHERGLKFREE